MQVVKSVPLSSACATSSLIQPYDLYKTHVTTSEKPALVSSVT